MYNKWVGHGRVGRDAEIRGTSGGSNVATFSMVTSDGKGDNVHNEWTKVVTFGKLADFVGERIKKGMEVLVEGRKRTNKWQDNDGNNRETVEMICNVVQVTKWIDNDRQAPQQQPITAPPAVQSEPDDDIPF